MRKSPVEGSACKTTAAPRECLRRKAMANRATAETEGNDEDSIVIKMSESKAMTEIITEVFREIQYIGSRLYLMSKRIPTSRKGGTPSVEKRSSSTRCWTR